MAWVVVPAWLQELLFFSLALLVCLVYLLAALLLELPVHQLPAMASLLLQCVQRAYKAMQSCTGGACHSEGKEYECLSSAESVPAAILIRSIACSLHIFCQSLFQAGEGLQAHRLTVRVSDSCRKADSLTAWCKHPLLCD